MLRLQGVLIGDRTGGGFLRVIRRITAVNGSKCEPIGVITVDELQQREIRNRNM